MAGTREQDVGIPVLHLPPTLPPCLGAPALSTCVTRLDRDGGKALFRLPLCLSTTTSFQIACQPYPQAIPCLEKTSFYTGRGGVRVAAFSRYARTDPADAADLIALFSCRSTVRCRLGYVFASSPSPPMRGAHSLLSLLHWPVAEFKWSPMQSSYIVRHMVF